MVLLTQEYSPDSSSESAGFITSHPSTAHSVCQYEIPTKLKPAIQPSEAGGSLDSCSQQTLKEGKLAFPQIFSQKRQHKAQNSQMGPPRWPHLKEGGDSGPMVGVQAPKHYLPAGPSSTVVPDGQNHWKWLLQKGEQVRKAFRKQRQSLGAVSALAGLEIQPLLCTVFLGFFWVAL